MANAQAVAALRQGWEAYRIWLEGHPVFHKVDLRNASLRGVELEGANLEDLDLTGADLEEAHFTHCQFSRSVFANTVLRGADFDACQLTGCSLDSCDLTSATLESCSIFDCDFTGTNFYGANLFESSMKECVLAGACLSKASIEGCQFVRVSFRGTDFQEVRLSWTDFTGCELRDARNMGEARFGGPCDVSRNTVAAAAGRIPTEFLVGAGLSDWEATLSKLFNPDVPADVSSELLYEAYGQRAGSPIVVGGVFISYSHADTDFVDTLQPLLAERKIKTWRDVHDLKAGKMERQIDKAMRLNPVVITVLSKASVSSDWVEYEASKARELERDLRRDVLCPITLDDAWKTSDWSGPLKQQMEKYYILPFHDWSNPTRLHGSFQKLISGLFENYIAVAKNSA